MQDRPRNDTMFVFLLLLYHQASARLNTNNQAHLVEESPEIGNGGGGEPDEVLTE